MSIPFFSIPLPEPENFVPAHTIHTISSSLTYFIWIGSIVEPGMGWELFQKELRGTANENMLPPTLKINAGTKENLGGEQENKCEYGNIVFSPPEN